MGFIKAISGLKLCVVTASLLLCACSVAWGQRSPEESFLKSITKSSELVKLSGREVSAPKAKSLRVVLVWASWCPYCDKGRAELEKMSWRMRNKAVTFQGISIEDSKEEAEKFAAQKKSVLDLYYYSGKAKKPKTLPAIPIVFIQDETGNLLSTYSGFSKERFGNIEKKILWLLNEEEG